MKAGFSLSSEPSDSIALLYEVNNDTVKPCLKQGTQFKECETVTH